MKKHFLSFVLGAMLLSAPVFATELYLIGDATSAGWTIESAVQMYDTVTPNVFTWSGDLKIGELKFLTQKDAWIPSYGPVTVDEEMVEGTVDLLLRDKNEMGTDHKFKVTACGWYTLVVDLTDAEKPSLNVSVFYPSTMYLIGPAVGGWNWDDFGQEMNREEEGVFTWKGDLKEGEFKFFEQKNFVATAYGANIDSTEVEVPGEYVLEKLSAVDKKYLANEGHVKLTLDLKQMKLIAEKDSTTAVENVSEIGNTTRIYDLRGMVCPRMEKGNIYIVKQGSKTSKVILQ